MMTCQLVHSDTAVNWFVKVNIFSQYFVFAKCPKNDKFQPTLTIRSHETVGIQEISPLEKLFQIIFDALHADNSNVFRETNKTYLYTKG